MKKILSLALAASMAVSVLPVAYAAEGENTYDNNYQGDMGTQITMVGTQEEAAGGAGDVWTVTVPAKMVPGDTGTVKAEGTWSADKYLRVTTPTSVTLTYGAQTMDVGITFDAMSKIGSSIEAVSKEQNISVADASRLFGTWEGVLEYTVELKVGDMNMDGVIDDADNTLLSNYRAGLATDLSETQIAHLDQYGDLTGDGQLRVDDSARLAGVIANG